jgi:hypothetical protein
MKFQWQIYMEIYNKFASETNSLRMLTLQEITNAIAI